MNWFISWERETWLARVLKFVNEHGVKRPSGGLIFLLLSWKSQYKFCYRNYFIDVYELPFFFLYSCCVIIFHNKLHFFFLPLLILCSNSLYIILAVRSSKDLQNNWARQNFQCVGMVKTLWLERPSCTQLTRRLLW